MALTSLSIPQNVDFTDPAELKKLNSYLYKLSEEIMYMFNNLSPADNFTNEDYIAYKQDLDKVASIQVDVDQIKLDYVNSQNIAEIVLNSDGIKQVFCTKDNVVQQINLSEEGVQISGSKINLTGTVTANNYFKILTDGSMECKEAKITGTIDGSEVKGSYIHAGEKVRYSGYDSRDNPIGERYKFEVGTDGIMYCQNFYFENGGYGAYIGAEVMACAGMECEGTIYCEVLDASDHVNGGEYVSADRLYGGLIGDSDRRVKKDIESIPEDLAVNIVKRLDPVSFRFKKNDLPSMGFIAQDVESICKGLKTELPLYEVKNDRYYIAYTNYIPLLVRAVQKLLREREN